MHLKIFMDTKAILYGTWKNAKRLYEFL